MHSLSPQQQDEELESLEAFIELLSVCDMAKN